MALTITLLLLGLSTGALIALPALGLVLMYRSSSVLNFATGAVGMTCSYLFWDVTQQHGWPAWAGGIAGVVFGATLGLASYAAIIVLPRRSSNLMRVIATLGILTVCQAAMQLRYGPNPLAIDDFLPGGTLDFGGGVIIPSSRPLLVAIALALTLILAWVYSRTTFGLATSAAAENQRKLAAMGWRIGLVGSLNWALGGALAGLAGVLLSPLTGVALTNGTSLTVTVLAASLIGGLRSFTLTVAGGMVIGMLQSLLVVHDLGIDGLADAVPFAVIVAVIVVRGRALPLRSFVGERLPSVGTGVVSMPRLALAAVAAVVLIGPILSDSGTAALTTSLLAAILLLSFTVLLGYAGQMSLAQVTLSGVGGLIAARLTADLGWPFLLVLLVGVLGTIPVGLIVGLPSARTRGVSLAIATLGLAVAIQSLLFDNESIAGGQFGVPLSLDGSFRLFGADFGSFSHPDRFAFLVLGVVIGLGVLVANLRRSASGRRMIAVRNNERAASGLGINVVGTKLWAFGIASAIAAVGGVLSAFRGPVAVFSTSSVLSNIVSIGYAVVGGVGSVIGALMGSNLEPSGAGNALLRQIVGVGPVTMALIGGVMLVFTVVTAPDGIAVAMLEGNKDRRRRREEARLDRWRADHLTGDATRSDPVAAATLDVRSVNVFFGAVQALDRVDLRVEPGEIVGVVGANGAGKTTLIDAITGFVPATGEIGLAGQSLEGQASHSRARLGISRSWQSLELIEDLSVLDNLRTASDAPRWWSPLVDLVHPERGAPTASLARAVEVLGLTDQLGATPGELSTGQRKLVALARAIATEPSVLLLDEPCSGLDQEERDEVAEVVITLARDWQMGVLLVEHDVHLVRRLADRIVALDFGRVIANGPPEAVLSDHNVVAAFLGASLDEAPTSAAPSAEGISSAEGVPS